MSIFHSLTAELQYEAQVTRKCLERLPEDKYDWKPHEKSMTMIRLATHIAEMTDWVTDAIEKPELDFAKMDYKPFEPKNNAELVEFFDEKIAKAVETLKDVPDEKFMENWKLRNGDEIYFDMPRFQVLRGMVFNHIIHHRGQLSVYLRLNDVPVPALYGPSADEGTM